MNHEFIHPVIHEVTPCHYVPDHDDFADGLPINIEELTISITKVIPLFKDNVVPLRPKDGKAS